MLTHGYRLESGSKTPRASGLEVGVRNGRRFIKNALGFTVRSNVLYTLVRDYLQGHQAAG
eukprot:1347552-Amorphochlora_amoeboformis.AAC.1